MAKSKEQLEIEKLELKLKRERENRRNLEDQYEQNKFLLQNAKEEIERLVFQVTHDLRAPITVLGQLVEDVLPSLPLKRRNVFLSSVARVQDISNEVLKRHKLGSSESYVDITKHTVDVVSQTSSIVQEKQVLFEDKSEVSISLEVNGLDSKSNEANIREMEFNCILSNLLVNSIDAIIAKGKDGKVAVSVEKTESDFVLVVKDNGIGIKEDDLRTIGKYRKTLKANGNGLGLYSSIHFLKKRGGTFKIESQYGQGTQVTITIPLANSDDKRIQVKQDGLLVVLDDDYIVHESINLCLESKQYNGQVLNFYSESDFRDWFKFAATDDKDSATFVVDGFIDSKFPNGPKIIRDLKISDRSVIFTGRANLIKKMNPPAPVYSKGKEFSDIFQLI